MGLEKIGVPRSVSISAMGTATALAGEAFDRLGDAAERKADSNFIMKTRLMSISCFLYGPSR